MITLTDKDYFLHSIASPPPVENSAMSWPVFLQLLEEYVCYRRWMIEYDLPSDFSCAIFARAEVADGQLPLFPDCFEMYVPTRRFMNCD